jgi:TolA-binding protein
MAASNAAGVPYLKATYLVDAGRALRQAGRTADAARAYRTILQKYSDTPSFTEAQVRLAELTAGKM